MHLSFITHPFLNSELIVIFNAIKTNSFWKIFKNLKKYNSEFNQFIKFKNVKIPNKLYSTLYHGKLWRKPASESERSKLLPTLSMSKPTNAKSKLIQYSFLKLSKINKKFFRERQQNIIPGLMEWSFMI